MIRYEKKKLKKVYTQADQNPFEKPLGPNCYEQMEADMEANPRWHLFNVAWGNDGNKLTVQYKVELEAQPEPYLDRLYREEQEGLGLKKRRD